MFKVLERWGAPDLSEDTQDLAPVFYDPTSFEEFEKEFRTPEDQETPAISVSMRMAGVALGAIVFAAGAVGYEAGQPDEQSIELSTQEIEQDLSDQGTTEPVPYLKNAELVIPKQESDDPAIAVKIPVDLGNDRYGTFVFDKDCDPKVVAIKSAAAPEHIEGEPEIQEVVYPLSVVYTNVRRKDGTIEKVCSVIAGDKSGNAANVVKIDTKDATPDQKRMLRDKHLKKLVKDAVGLASQDRVGYLDKAS